MKLSRLAGATVALASTFALASTASAATLHSGTISYSRSFTAPNPQYCAEPDGLVDGAETESENWTVTFGSVTVPANDQPGSVGGHITGTMQEEVTCPDHTDSFSVSTPGPVQVAVRGAPGGIQIGVSPGEGLGGNSSDVGPISVAPDFEVTVPDNGVLRQQVSDSPDYAFGADDSTDTDPTQTHTHLGTMTVTLHSNLHLVTDNVKSTGNPVSVNVLRNDKGDGLRLVRAAAHPAHGTAACGSNGVCVYSPGKSYRGNDSFSYTATDSSGHRASARVFVRSKGGAGITFQSLPSGNPPYTTWPFTTPSGKPSCGSDYLTVTFYSKKRDFDVDGTLNPHTSCGESPYELDNADGVYLEYQEALSDSNDPGFTRLKTSPRDATPDSGGFQFHVHVHHFTFPTVHVQGVRLRMCEDIPGAGDKCNNWHWEANPFD